MLLVILKAKKLLERFTKKNCKKTNQKGFIVEKVIKRKGDKLYVKWKDYDKSFNSWIDKKDKVYMSEYSPEPKLDLLNYATKVDLKNATGVNTSNFAKKADLANLNSNVDKLDIDKLKNVPTNLNNLKSKSR